MSTLWPVNADTYGIYGYYASIAGWSPLKPLAVTATWLTLLPALNIKYSNGVWAGTGVPEYINVLTKCSTYGLQLVARENAAKIDVNKTSNGFALTGFCVNMRGTEPYVVAYNTFLSTATSGTLTIPTAVKQHNLYSL